MSKYEARNIAADLATNKVSRQRPSPEIIEMRLMRRFAIRRDDRHSPEWLARSLGKRRRGQRLARRNGAALVITIVCLTVVLLLSAAIVQNLAFHQRQSRADQQRLQAFWLAESAVDRAMAALQLDPDYAGTVWQIEIAGAHGPQTGVAEIQVESDESSSRQRRIHIVARWPNDPVHRYVHQKDLVIKLPKPRDSQ